MKPTLVKRNILKTTSLTLSNHIFPHFLKLWHYHPEIELVYVKSSTGTLFIGNSVDRFEAGDMVLIGSNLPHMWLNDEEYFQEGHQKTAEAVVIHSSISSFGKGFLEIPEMESVQRLLFQARRGLAVKKKSRQEAAAAIKGMEELSDFDRMITFIQLLKSLSESTGLVPISHADFFDKFHNTKNRKLKAVFEYTSVYFQHKITLGKVAQVANMNKTAFCRYFKQVTGKTFFKYLTELRVSYSCKLLREKTDATVSEIAYSSGFNNISHFNHQFKNIMGTTPKAYLTQVSR